MKFRLLLSSIFVIILLVSEIVVGASGPYPYHRARQHGHHRNQYRHNHQRRHGGHRYAAQLAAQRQAQQRAMAQQRAPQQRAAAPVQRLSEQQQLEFALRQSRETARQEEQKRRAAARPGARASVTPPVQARSTSGRFTELPNQQIAQQYLEQMRVEEAIIIEQIRKSLRLSPQQLQRWIQRYERDWPRIIARDKRMRQARSKRSRLQAVAERIIAQLKQRWNYRGDIAVYITDVQVLGEGSVAVASSDYIEISETAIRRDQARGFLQTEAEFAGILAHEFQHARHGDHRTVSMFQEAGLPEGSPLNIRLRRFFERRADIEGALSGYIYAFGYRRFLEQYMSSGPGGSLVHEPLKQSVAYVTEVINNCYRR